MDRIKIPQAIVVEGRDDVRAVEAACEALVIATHGYGISAETWAVLDKAYRDKGLIIFTDPDHAGREIRKRLEARFADAVHAHLSREDARYGADIGIENASPESIADAIEKALRLSGGSSDRRDESARYADMTDLTELGLAGGDGASERRARVCKELGIGYSNASAMIKKLRGFEIDINELKEALEKIK